MIFLGSGGILLTLNQRKMLQMDLAAKKIELINWLTLQDEAMIKKIEELRKSSMDLTYKARMTEKLESKLRRSDADIKAGKTYSQDEVEARFKSKFRRWKTHMLSGQMNQ